MASDRQTRIAGIRSAMADAGLDALVVAGRGMVSQYGHLEYLSGYTPVVRLAYGILTATEGPILIVPTAADAWYAGQVDDPVDDIRVAGQGDVVAAWDDLPSAVAAALREADVAEGRVGIAGLRQIMPAGDLEALRAALPSADLLEGTAVISGLKLLKDEGEADELRRSGAIASTGLAACRETLRVGASEREVAAGIEAAVRRHGARDVLVFVSAAPYFLGRAGDRRFETGDLVTAYAEISGATGYWVETAALYALGDLDDDRERLAQSCLAAARGAEAQLRAGRTAADVARPIDEHAATDRLNAGIWHGHGVGLDHDGPVITAGDETELRPGMVISVHPNFSTADERLGASVAATYLVTAGGGPERLTGDVAADVVRLPGAA